MPPPAAATKKVFDGLGMPTMSATRPSKLAGPTVRQRKPAMVRESSVCASAAIATLVRAAPARSETIRKRCIRTPRGGTNWSGNDTVTERRRGVLKLPGFGAAALPGAIEFAARIAPRPNRSAEIPPTLGVTRSLTDVAKSSRIRAARFGAPPVRGKGILPPNRQWQIEFGLSPACAQRTSGATEEGLMSNEFPPRRYRLASLNEHAKRWLDAIQAGVAEARDRLQRAIPELSATPTLRDIQHALARDHGFPGWTALKKSLEEAVAAGRAAGAAALAQYETMAEALLQAYQSGTPEAMERHYRYTWHRRAWQAMRSYVQLDLGKRPTEPGGEVDITLDDARHLVAIEH